MEAAVKALAEVAEQRQKRMVLSAGERVHLEKQKARREKDKRRKKEKARRKSPTASRQPSPV